MKQWVTVAAVFLVLIPASTAMASDATEALLQIDRDFAREAQTLRELPAADTPRRLQ